MQPALLAVDAGGTNTRAALVAVTGEVLGVGRAGAGNPIAVGLDQAVAHVAEACRAACAVSSGVRPQSAMVTMAGIMSAETQRAALGVQLVAAGLPADVAFESDVLSAWFAGTAAVDGLVLVVGTGAVGGRVASGRLVRVSDGLGWLVGDGGSGFWIGRRAVAAAAKDLDGRGPATAITDEVLAHFGVTRTDGTVAGRPSALVAMLGEVYSRRPVELARLAPIVLRHAADPVAAHILDLAATELARTVECLDADQAKQTDPGTTPLVLAGGLVGPASALREHLLPRLSGRRCLTATDGLAGAALLALRRAGAEANQVTLQRLVAGIGTV